MLGTCLEEYTENNNGLPFLLMADIVKTCFTCRKEQNWHEDIEIQLCEKGEGTVILNGERYAFKKGDIAIANSNVIHYTGTDGDLTYTCIIVRNSFCKQMGIDTGKLNFEGFTRSEILESLISELKAVYFSNLPFKTVRLTQILLTLLIEMTDNHLLEPNESPGDSRSLERVRQSVNYIRQNYTEKISLDDISKYVKADKYALCRDFKRIAGQTIVEYINNYRCQKAAEYLKEGHTVSEAAFASGFENLSFFTKTFKRYIGVLPSNYRS